MTGFDTSESDELTTLRTLVLAYYDSVAPLEVQQAWLALVKHIEAKYRVGEKEKNNE